MPLDAIVGAEFIEGVQREFFTTIGAELAVVLQLGSCLDASYCHLCFVLRGAKHKPHEPTVIIHEDKKVALVAGHGRRDGAAHRSACNNSSFSITQNFARNESRCCLLVRHVSHS